MTNHNHQYIIHEKHEKCSHSDKLRKIVDKIILAIAIVGPISHIPQLIKIWYYKNATGVSVISWSAFSIMSFFWLIYGILHKDRPIVIMFSILTVVQAMVAIGAVLYG